MERYLSTGRVARICQVSPMTIAKWIDEGSLPGHTTPGGHRRVAISDLVVFLEVHGMRVPNELQRDRKIRVLAVHGDPDYLGRLADAVIGAGDRYEYRGTTAGVDALVAVGEWRPHVLLLDLELPDVDGVQICRRLSELASDFDTRVIAVAPRLNGNAARSALDAGAARCVSEEELAERVIEVLDEMVKVNNGPVTRTARSGPAAHDDVRRRE